MSMTSQPKHPLLKAWQHFAAMSPQTLTLLLLLILVVGVIDPLIPILAYGLQFWAAGSWMWQDRWASLTATTKKGGMYLTCLLIYVLLNQTHLWIIPEITANLQTIWHVHLPGVLSLSPLDGQALIARSLLLLPLTPAMALLYERIDPRTHHPLTRILTPADLAEPEPVVPPEPEPAAPLEPESKPEPATNTPRTPKKRKTPTRTTRRAKETKSLQITIENSPEAPEPSEPPPAPEINWNDLAE
ncbi:hypothetical protein [Dictyobacter arantiisoli]|uniref:Uncharacterized protein n=1 Tax=Dictyobacter arantiisoli TaxID=2014874 RepID=A0A5A5TI88_9CHLR|nr:hypothetical protein [Dictyobacter arantiisoli]GCF10908.1 hypothetical protein KDI_44720 [Dictyobacter arantiisoli]